MVLVKPLVRCLACDKYLIKLRSPYELQTQNLGIIISLR